MRCRVVVVVPCSYTLVKQRCYSFVVFVVFVVLLLFLVLFLLFFLIKLFLYCVGVVFVNLRRATVPKYYGGEGVSLWCTICVLDLVCWLAGLLVC